MISNHLKLS